MKISKGPPKCYFWQDGTCIVHSWWWCLVCPWRIKKIKQLTDIKSYLDLVNTRHSANRSFIVSVFSLVTAVISMLVAFLVLLTRENGAALFIEVFSWK